MHSDKEYGGYLPFELNRAAPYYNFGKGKQADVNSGLTAVFAALNAIRPEAVWLPVFICPTVKALVSQMGLKIKEYRINSEFEPTDISCSRKECIILVNYFGINREMTERNYPRYENVIIDNTQAFFSEPVFRKGVYNVYSCRKFIGTADGGYLIGEEVPELSLEKDHSSDRASFLLMQYEYGTNAAYGKSLENYDRIKDKRRSMSDLTEIMLASVDYERIKKVRRDNFEAMCSFLGEANQLKALTLADDVPYSYPFMTDKNIRSALLRKHIYSPHIWSNNLTERDRGTQEYLFTENIYHLPVDQRYNANDMKNISDTVKHILEEAE